MREMTTRKNAKSRDNSAENLSGNPKPGGLGGVQITIFRTLYR